MIQIILTGHSSVRAGLFGLVVAPLVLSKASLSVPPARSEYDSFVFRA